jgi:hypothetical protein
LSNIPYHSIKKQPGGVSTNQGTWTYSNVGLVDDVLQAADIVYAGAYDSILTYDFTNTIGEISSANMVMGIELVASIQTTGDSGMQFVVERKNTPGKKLCEFPRYSDSELYTSIGGIAEKRLFLANKPFERVFGPDTAWDNPTSLDEYSFGFKVVGTSGTLNVSEFYIRVYYREAITFDEISTASRSAAFQFVEIEGIRYIPTDLKIAPEGRRDVQDYYFGWERFALPGTMKTIGDIRSGKVDFSTGIVEYPSASISLIDVNKVSFEDGHRIIKKNGFYSWLTCYADRTSFYYGILTDGTGAGYNTIKGLNPQNDAQELGQICHVEDITGAPSANTIDSYLYLGKEAIWYGTSNATNDTFGVGDNSTYIARGQFSSDNYPHVYNRTTGVYPEISSHPLSWTGRLVRIWTVPFDPVTGFPMPISYGTARSFIWASHENIVGPGENQINVSLAPLNTVLDKKLVDVESAPLEKLSFGSGNKQIRIFEGNDAVLLERNSTFWALNLDETYNSVFDLVEDINSDLLPNAVKIWGVATGFLASWQANVINGKLSLKAYGPVNWIGNDVSNVGVYQSGDMQHYTGWDAEPTMESYDSSDMVVRKTQKKGYVTYLNATAEKIYANSDIINSWGLTDYGVNSPHYIDPAGGSCVQMIRVGDEEYFAPKSNATSDSYGSYVSVYSGEFWPVESEKGREPVGQEVGKKPVSVSPVMVWTGSDVSKILIAHLVSKGFGTDTTGYDFLPFGASLMLNSSFINYTQMEMECDYLRGFGARTFVADDKTTYKELLDQELKLPVPIVLGQDRYGRYTLISEQSQVNSRDNNLPSISDSHVLRNKRLSVGYSRENIVNKIVLKCDYSVAEEKFMTTLVAVESNSMQTYGERQIEISSKLIRSDRIGGTGSVISNNENVFSAFVGMASWLFRCRAWEVPTISFSTNARGLSLHSGQPISLTLENIQDITNSNATGIDGRKCQIVKIDKDSITGECKIQVVFDRFKTRSAGWSPSLIVSSVSGAVITVETDKFSYSDPPYSNLENSDLLYFSSGDAVTIMDYNSETPNYDYRTIASIDLSSSEITLNSAPSNTYAAGDVIIFSDYDKLTPAQKAHNYATMADPTGFINGSQDVEGFSYRA